MNLLPIKIIEINQTKINHNERITRPIYCLIIYSGVDVDDNSLDNYLNLHKIL